MKKSKPFLIIVLHFLFLIQFFSVSCTHEIPVPVTPIDSTNQNGQNGCSPDTVYFNNKVLPFIVQNCAQSGCHDATTMARNVLLTSYNSIMTTADVVPGRPDNSDLYKVIDRNEMPPSGPLTTEQKNMIYTWILQGAKNNTCNDCDTSIYSYTGAISKTVRDYCIACHSGPNVGTTGGGILLDNYDNVKIQGINGKLLQSVKHTGYFPMPKSGNKLSDCRISQIEKWIINNYPN